MKPLRWNKQSRAIARWAGRLALGWALLTGWPATKALAQYRFDHWTADNGLPQNSVRDIVQTRDGYLWLATFDGLVRFDGVRFTVFNKSNSPGIASNRFTTLFEDKDGDLWAALETGGLVRRHRGHFTTYTTGHGLPIDFVNGMGSDGQGNLVLMQGEGEQAFRWWRGEFQRANELRLPLKSAAVEPSDRRQHLAAVNLNLRLLYFADGQLQALESADVPFNRGLIYKTSIQDTPGNTWFVMPGNLVRMLQGRVAQIYSYPGEDLTLVSGSHPQQVIAHDKKQQLWLLEPETQRRELITAQAPAGLKIGISYADREGNYWFATYSDGLYRARQQTVTAYATPQGLSAQELYPVLEDRDGSLWVGSAAQGLFHSQGHRFVAVKSPLKPGETLNSLYQDRAGRLWLNGMWRTEKGSFVRGVSAEVIPNPLPFVWTMHEDEAGAYWFGTIGGVVRYANGMTTRFTVQEGLAGNDTKVIIPDTAGGLWLGSYGGLTHYKEGHWQSWTEKDGLPGNTVRTLYQEHDGTLWIGTYDSGLGRFKDGRFTRYSVTDGLFDNGIFQILEDDYGWLWMSCNRGIFRVQKQELNNFADGKIKLLNALAYNKSDGMPSTECNGGRWPAGIKTRDGKLWFPTMGGLAMIDPAKVRTNPQPPPVVIEDVRINNQPINLDVLNAALSTPTAAIELKPGQENFEIQYTALSFINAENLRFKYKLVGADEDWIEVGTRRTAYYSYVAPGNYTFQVIAANSDGVWNSTGQAIRIQVLPPFYRTWWFLTLATLLVSGTVFAAFKYRVNQLEQRQAAHVAFARQLIESQEAERKRLAAELHDSLGQHLLVIKNRAALGEQATSAQTPAREQFDEITASASQAISEVRAISHNLRPINLERLGLTAVIEEMVERVAQGTGLQFSTDIEPLDGLLSKEGEINLFRILQESVNNILKHAQATKAYLEIWRAGDELRVTVRDNGRGYDVVTTPQRGLGLTSMSERVRILGGTQNVTTAPGAGTMIELKIPLTNNTPPETEKA